MSKQTSFDKVGLLGVDIDAISMTDAIQYIISRTSPGQPAGYITKPYVEFMDQAYRNPKLQELINQGDVTLADGVALIWAAHFLYAGKRSFVRFWLTLSQIIFAPHELRWPLVDRTAGINFTHDLIAEATRQNRSIYLIGSPRGSSIEQTAITLANTFPTLKIVGTRSGRDATMPQGHVSDGWLENTATAITKSKPDIILVGMGFPLQEQVCAYLAAHANHGIFIGEGGTFDYESFGGQRRKAPRALQRSGLEWLWRLILEPSRFRRQLAIPRFMYRIWRHR